MKTLKLFHFFTFSLLKLKAERYLILLIVVFVVVLNMIGYICLGEGKESLKKKLRNPFTITQGGLPHVFPSCGTCEPTYIKDKVAKGIIERVFKEEGFTLEKNYHFKKGKSSFIVDGYDLKRNIGYVFAGGHNLENDAVHRWWMQRKHFLENKPEECRKRIQVIAPLLSEKKRKFIEEVKKEYKDDYWVYFFHISRLEEQWDSRDLTEKLDVSVMRNEIGFMQLVLPGSFDREIKNTLNLSDKEKMHRQYLKLLTATRKKLLAEDNWGSLKPDQIRRDLEILKYDYTGQVKNEIDRIISIQDGKELRENYDIFIKKMNDRWISLAEIRELSATALQEKKFIAVISKFDRRFCSGIWGVNLEDWEEVHKEMNKKGYYSYEEMKKIMAKRALDRLEKNVRQYIEWAHSNGL